MTTPTATKTTRVFIDIRLLLHNAGTVSPKARRVTGAGLCRGAQQCPPRGRLKERAGRQVRVGRHPRAGEPHQQPVASAPMMPTIVKARECPFGLSGLLASIVVCLTLIFRRWRYGRHVFDHRDGPERRGTMNVVQLKPRPKRPVPRAVAAVAANPEKSDRTTGVNHAAVNRARKSGADQSAPERVTGRDGKKYPAKRKLYVVPDSGEAAADRANALSRHLIGAVRDFERAFTGERRLNRQANHEPSLAMSFVVLFVVLTALVAIVANVSVSDIQLSTAADFFDGPS
jgi:hypothetical protein